MGDELFEHKVTDRKSFLHFLELLLKDYQNNASEWENTTIETFLEAMARWGEAAQGYYDNVFPNEGINADNATWRIFADLLRAASIYE